MTTPGCDTIAGRRLFCSWSGGKDAYLALQRAVAAGGKPEVLLCMAHEDGLRSRGHGLPLPLREGQAAALNLRLVTRVTTWDDYEATYIAALHELRAAGLQGGVFGDIDLEPHREWVEHVCAAAGMACHLPLWLEPRVPLIEELLAGGARSTIVAVDAKRLDERFLGLELTLDLVAELEELGVDACGEEGEFHTFVTAAPLFSGPVPLTWHGNETRDGHWVLRFT
jgi:diphthine-ammonia ligase